MSFLSRLFHGFLTSISERKTESGISASYDDLDERTASATVINPSTGLPMLSGIGGLDVGGNPYGVSYDTHRRSAFENDSSMFGHDCGSSFDHNTSSFDCGSSFDSFSSNDYGCRYD